MIRIVGGNMKMTAEQEYENTVRKLEKKKARQKAIMAAIKYLKVSGVYSYVTGEKYGRTE